MSDFNFDFDGNDYRKRVLAPIEARGGVQTSDPFEFYDLPLTDMRDSVVATQVDAVWAFWQKQRDSPKYRGLVTALLEAHREVAPLMLDRQSRQRLAEMAKQFRAERDTDRFAELDGAVARLVERFGGIPTSKLDGLRRFAEAAGLDAAAVQARLTAVPVVQTRDEPAAAPLPVAVGRQVRADLDELGRLLGTPPPATLYDLLGLSPSASRDDIARERAVAAARNRELRPDRRRALVDDLLAAVTRLLLDGDPEAYLDAVAEDVTSRLRPRLAAALLVEDTLTPDDHQHLLAEAETAGLDPARAARVLATLAGEAGVPVPPPTSRPTSRRPAPRRPAPASTGAPYGAPYTADLSAARAALRAGRVVEAQRLVDQARRQAGETLPPIRAVADEVAGVLAEAHQQWRAATQALAARRFGEAESALDRLVHIALDLTGPGGAQAQVSLAQARAGLAAAAVLLDQAEALDGPARESALLAAAREFPDAEPLLHALRSLPVQPASDVRVEPTPGGALVRWRPSASTGPLDYQVVRIAPDGSRRTLGATQALELEDGEPPRGALPDYVVVVRRAGVRSAEARSGAGPAGAAPPPPPPPPQHLPPPVTTLRATPFGRRVRLIFTPAPTGRSQVRRLGAGVRPPALGSPVPDPEALGALVPAMGPGLAVDRRPQCATSYVVVTVDGTTAVAGGSLTVVDLPAVAGLRCEGDRLRWDWPPGCTEVLILWRPDALPAGADDPLSQRRKTTNTRYEIDGGAALPPDRPLHVAVFACTRDGATLVPALEAPTTARLSLPDDAASGRPVGPA